ncbi:MAG: LptA/OstA family protein [Halanaerobiales bacterium]
MIPIRLFIIITIMIAFLSFAVMGEAPSAVESTARGEGEGFWADTLNFTLLDGEVNEATAEGNALLIYENYSIKADIIEYNMQTKDIAAEGNIVFNDGEYILYADRITGNLSSQDFNAVGNVIFEGSHQGEALKLTSEELTVRNNNPENIAEQNGSENSTAQDNNSGNIASRNNAQLMTFTGDVSLRYGEIETYSDSLRYNTADNTAFLEGNVSGRQEEIRLSGEKVEIDLNTEKMRLLNGGLLFNSEGEE